MGTGTPTSNHAPSEERLDDRIVRVIQGQAGHISFNGLRRSLSAHPESLSRALRRLERFGVVLHDEGGYALAEGPGTEVDAGVRTAFRRVGEVELPRGVSQAWVLGQFAGRWFRDLRWVGAVEGPGDPWLVWSVPGAAGHVLLTLGEGRLRVGVDGSSPAEAERLEAAARALLASGLERLARPMETARAGVRFFSSDPFLAPPGPN